MSGVNPVLFATSLEVLVVSNPSLLVGVRLVSEESLVLFGGVVRELIDSEGEGEVVLLGMLEVLQEVFLEDLVPSLVLFLGSI